MTLTASSPVRPAVWTSVHPSWTSSTLASVLTEEQDLYLYLWKSEQAKLQNTDSLRKFSPHFVCPIIKSSARRPRWGFPPNPHYRLTCCLSKSLHQNPSMVRCGRVQCRLVWTTVIQLSQSCLQVKPLIVLLYLIASVAELRLTAVHWIPYHTHRLSVLL